MNANIFLSVCENRLKVGAIAAVARNLASYILSAMLAPLTKSFTNRAYGLLGAVGQPHVDLYWNLAFSTMFAISLLIKVHLYAIGVQQQF